MCSDRDSTSDVKLADVPGLVKVALEASRDANAEHCDQEDVIAFKLISFKRFVPGLTALSFNVVENFPASINLSIGESFVGDHDYEFTVVGYAPSKPSFSVVCVPKWQFDDIEFDFSDPACFTPYRVEFVLAKITGSVGLHTLRCRRLQEYLPLYNISFEMTRTPFTINLDNAGGLKRARVIDFKPTNKRYKVILELDDGRSWRVTPGFLLENAQTV